MINYKLLFYREWARNDLKEKCFNFSDIEDEKEGLPKIENFISTAMADDHHKGIKLIIFRNGEIMRSNFYIQKIFTPGEVR